MPETPPPPQRWAIRQLMTAAIEARRAGQYVTMGRLAAQAVPLAEQLGDLRWLVWTRHRLADAWRMQGRYADALPIYIWLIGLATDPGTRGQLAEEWCQFNLTLAFIECVAAGRVLAQPTAQLHQVVQAGLDWLDSIGHPQWAASLRLQRGELLEQQGALEAARRELEAALALRQRNPSGPGYSLADHQLTLADLLGDDAVGAYAEAAALAEAVLGAPASNLWDRFRATRTLSAAWSDLGADTEAFAMAEAARALATPMEGPRAQYFLYNLLEYVYRRAGQAEAAVRAAAGQWGWARRLGTPGVRHRALVSGAQVRLLQARLAAGLPAAGGDAPVAGSPGADTRRARQYLASAQRFLARARALAQQLDQAAGTHHRQERLDLLAADIIALAARLAPEGPP